MTPRTPETALANCLVYLKRLSDADFYGSITLKFEHGAIVHVCAQQSMKPSELSELPRFTHAHE